MHGRELEATDLYLLRRSLLALALYCALQSLLRLGLALCSALQSLLQEIVWSELCFAKTLSKSASECRKDY